MTPVIVNAPGRADSVCRRATRPDIGVVPAHCVRHPGGYTRRMNLGATELLIIMAIVLLLFGSTKLPKLARSLGEAQKEFKKGNDGQVADGAERVGGDDTQA
jgi:sec-independent protein translocase protein TatA